MQTARGVIELIGNTPILKVDGLDTGRCELYLKLENQNPGGSIKDRIGLSMIRAAEREGKLGGGQRHLVEATAGNTGLGLALVAAQRGYRLTLVIPDKMSQEKIFHLRALGVEVVMTRSDVEKGNPANPIAHETGTAPEIAKQLGGRLHAMVCGVGSGGTLTGLSRYFAKAISSCEMVLADPEGSVLKGVVETGRVGKAGSWLVEGIGEDFVPPNCDLSRVKRAYAISDRESFETARALLRTCGVLAGSSTGTLLAAALRYCREQTSPRRVCTLVCDSGNKYLSKMFNDFWMADQGFADRTPTGDLRDLVSRRHAEGKVQTVAPGDPLLVAYGRMKLHDVSQLPVLEDGKVIGLVDEGDLLLAAVEGGPGSFRRQVREVMSTRLHTVPVTAPVKELLP